MAWILQSKIYFQLLQPKSLFKCDSTKKRSYIVGLHLNESLYLQIQLKSNIFSTQTRNELREYKDYMEKNKEEKKNMLKYKRLEEEAKRNHYLISTRQIPGVYNSPYKPYIYIARKMRNQIDFKTKLLKYIILKKSN